MWDGMSMSGAINSAFKKLFFVSKVISIILITIIVSIIIIKYLLKRANKNDPSGNAKRILIHTIIAILAGIIIIVIARLGLISMEISYIILFIAINLIACIYGPVAGFLVGFGGMIIGELADTGYNVWFWLKEGYFYITIGLYGLLIGFFWKKIIPGKNGINIVNIIIFCLFQFICHLILCVLIYNFSLYMLFDNLKKYHTYYIIVTIVTGVILFIYKYNIDIRRSEREEKS